MMPDKTEYVTYKDLSDALNKFGDKMSIQMEKVSQDLRAQIASDRGEFKAQLTAGKPQGGTIAAWASVCLTVVIVLCGALFYYFNLRHELQDAC